MGKITWEAKHLKKICVTLCQHGLVPAVQCNHSVSAYCTTFYRKGQFIHYDAKRNLNVFLKQVLPWLPLMSIWPPILGMFSPTEWSSQPLVSFALQSPCFFPPESLEVFLFCPSPRAPPMHHGIETVSLRKWSKATAMTDRQTNRETSPGAECVSQGLEQPEQQAFLHRLTLFICFWQVSSLRLSFLFFPPFFSPLLCGVGVVRLTWAGWGRLPCQRVREGGKWVCVVCMWVSFITCIYVYCVWKRERRERESEWVG